MNKIKIKAYDKEFDLDIEVGKFETDGSPAIILFDNDLPFGKLNYYSDEPVSEGEIAVKTWSENAEWFEQLLQHPAFEDTGRRVAAGRATGHVWKVNLKELEK